MSETQRHCPVCSAVVSDDEVRCPVCTSVLPPRDVIPRRKKEPRQQPGIVSQVPPDPEPVGFGPRCIAAIVDTALILTVILPCLLIIYGRAYFSPDPLIKGPLDALLSVILPAIVVIACWICCGATPGKMMIGARIVDAATGGKAKPVQYIVRYYAYIIAAIPLFAGFFAIIADPRRQGWHDKLAGTMVVRMGRRQAGA